MYGTLGSLKRNRMTDWLTPLCIVLPEKLTVS
jgi:hypothetical protein